jgi:hypothetical protein
VHLFGLGGDSGTFDYFTQAIVDPPRASQTDYTGSEDDTVSVRCVIADGPIASSPTTMANGTYHPRWRADGRRDGREATRNRERGRCPQTPDEPGLWYSAACTVPVSRPPGLAM